VSFLQDPHYNAGANRVIGAALAAALLGEDPAGGTVGN
jgi:hypothetical protein